MIAMRWCHGTPREEVGLYSGVSILVLSSVGKAVSTITLGWPSGREPVFLLPEGWLSVATMVLEIAAVCIVLAGKDRLLRALILCGFGAAFVSYHGALLAVGYAGGCNCFGSLWKVVGLTGKADALISLVLALWLLVIGLCVALTEVRRRWSVA
jgi:hypothetical protein